MAKTTEVPRNLSNSRIRILAWERTISLYGRLLVADIIISIPAIISVILTLLSDTDTIFLEISLIMFIFTPLTIGGFIFFYEIYAYGEAKFSSFFYFYTKKKQLITSVLLGFVNIVISLSISLTVQWLDFLKSNLLLYTCLSILALTILFWLSFRLFLVYYIFRLDEEKSARSIILESIHYTKYKFLEYLWFAITIIWWIVLLSIFLLIFLLIILPMEYCLLSFIPLFLFGPYIQMAIAGYAHKLLPNPNAKKKRSKKESSDTIS